MGGEVVSHPCQLLRLLEDRVELTTLTRPVVPRT